MSTFTISAGTIGPGRPMPRAATVARSRMGGPARLTRRGRLVLSLVVIGLLVVAAVLMSGGVAAVAGSPGGSPVATERVTVRPGDTLWAIAEREAPGVDPRETVARILDLNALESSAVRAGSVLLLPSR